MTFSNNVGFPAVNKQYLWNFVIASHEKIVCFVNNILEKNGENGKKLLCCTIVWINHLQNIILRWKYPSSRAYVCCLGIEGLFLELSTGFLEWYSYSAIFRNYLQDLLPHQVYLLIVQSLLQFLFFHHRIFMKLLLHIILQVAF